MEKWELERKEQEYQSRLEEQRAKLEPAFINERASKMLELLATKEPDGQTLYKIYELAEDNPSNRTGFQSMFAISTTEFSRFKDAVHNPSVSGDWARHAYPDTPKSSNLMSKGEAESFVRDIAKSWLDYVRKHKVP